MLLLHGLGATGAVWRAWDGVAPDLPGHGAAAWDPPYSFARHAEAVLPLLGAEPVTVVGHSMGGVVALARSLFQSSDRGPQLPSVMRSGLHPWLMNQSAPRSTWA